MFQILGFGTLELFGVWVGFYEEVGVGDQAVRGFRGLRAPRSEIRD